MQYLTPFPGFRKTQILGRRQEELRHALKHDATPDKVAKAAERVRVAKLHLIKALQAALAEHNEIVRHAFPIFGVPILLTILNLLFGRSQSTPPAEPAKKTTTTHP